MAGQARARRERSATESLLSIALAMEAALTFFVAMTAFGLKALPAAVAFGGGAALLVAFAVMSRLMKFNWAIWIAWGLQAVLILVGLAMPLMYLIGAGFAALFVYCYFTGKRLDAANSNRLPAEEEK